VFLRVSLSRFSSVRDYVTLSYSDVESCRAIGARAAALVALDREPPTLENLESFALSLDVHAADASVSELVRDRG